MHSKSGRPAGRRTSRRGPVGTGRLGAVFLSATVASFVWTGPALATPAAGDPSSTGTVTANVAVGASIVLSFVNTSFTLAGFPGDRPADVPAVTMHVLTNNATGYNVTILPAADILVGTGTNADTIPVTDLSVRETGTLTYLQLPLSTGPALQVYNQTTKSVNSPGDLLSNDYEMNTPIPNVNNDTYSVILDYVASTNL